MSPYGAYDMVGNVREWVDAWETNRHTGLPSRVARGGSWRDGASMIRCTQRSTHNTPDARKPFIGFRVVLDPAILP